MANSCASEKEEERVERGRDLLILLITWAFRPTSTLRFKIVNGSRQKWKCIIRLNRGHLLIQHKAANFIYRHGFGYLLKHLWMSV